MPHAPTFPFPLLVGDIGGTNARFAMVDAPGVRLRVLTRAHTADYAGVAEAMLAATAHESVRPRSAILCGAGPVDGRTLTLTNAPWTIDGPALVAAGVVAEGLLLNDFEAQALALPAIPDAYLQRIGPDLPSHGPLVVLGPGTGLGIGALLHVDDRFVPVPSEACHIGFGPDGADEERWWPHLERARGRITTEAVMSGPGLVRVHKARAAADGRPTPALDGPGIVARALADRGGEEARTCRAFLRLVARFAGDIGITFVATGGVTLAGGILPRMRELIDPVEFRRVFEDKAPVDGLARRIGTRLVVEPEAVLEGLAAIGATPGRYVLEYGERLWSA
ncbi:glucokinase [Alsobacter sp. SYSU M60028]|uniref:Glucokinase n=1 Tax=Alsobacter ponti TaxID=2962936 RepID=A0ABT1LBG9_9HYPH|nr:glucokinase [Alsobacter ponti]MCP8938832.1 glucokinase [Alsobacter ponti]